MVGSKPEVCQRIGIRAYPTWIIAEARCEDVLPFAEMARASRFPGVPKAAGNRDSMGPWPAGW